MGITVAWMREKAAQGLRPGDRFAVTRRFSEDDVAAFAELTKDFNPVHFDNRFAAAKGFPRPICHGLLVASLLTEIGGQIAWLASGMSFRFLGPAYPGEDLHCTLVIESIDHRGRARAVADVITADNRCVLTAELFGRVPMDSERQLLGAIP
jgi:acyl dehydratase